MAREKMRFMRLTVLGFLGVLVIFALPFASMGEGATAGMVAALEGDVRVRHSGETQFVPARLHQPVSQGDRFRTGDDGKAKILFDDDSMVVLGTGSDLEINEYVFRRESGERKALLGLLQGKVRFLVTRFLLERKEDFRVQTSQAVVGVRGTEGIVRVLNPTVAYCLNGALVVQNPSTGESRDLGPLTKAWVERGQPMVVEPIDPKDVQGLRAEFQIERRSSGEPPPFPTGPSPPRDEPSTRDKIQELIPKDITLPDHPKDVTLPDHPKDGTEPARQQRPRYE